MQQAITKKQQIRSKVDSLLQNNTFITWGMLGISVLNNFNYATYDAKVVFEYMKELGIEYMRYSDKYPDKKMHGNTGGFYNDIARRRKRKLQRIIGKYQN